MPAASLVRLCLAPNWKRLALVIVLVLLSLVLELGGPLIARQFIDGATGGASLDQLVGLAALFLAAGVGNQLFSVSGGGLAADVSTRATNRLREFMTEHAFRLPLPFHHHHPPGEMIERLEDDVGLLSVVLGSLPGLVVGNLLVFAGSLGIAIAVDWRAGLVLVGYSLLLLAALVRVRSAAVSPVGSMLAANATTYSMLEEWLGGTEDIRSSGAVPYVMRRFSELLRRRAWTSFRAQLVEQSVLVLAINGGAVGGTLSLAAGVWLFLGGEITMGTVYLFYSLSQQVNGPIRALTFQFRSYVRGAAAFGRVNELLSVQPLAPDAGRSLPEGPLDLALDNVTFGYGDEPVLRNVSLHVPAGSVLGLLGRTGSGKTTIGRLIVRLYQPWTGAIRLGGADLHDVALASVRERVGVVTQEVQLFAATIRENVTLFRTGYSDRLIVETLALLGLGPWLDRQPAGLDTVLGPEGGQLSAGEAQLLALVRIFLRDPAVIVLDEASSRLDPATERQVERAMATLLAGRTAIVIAHRLATIERADQIAILENGQVVEQGDRRWLVNDAGSRYRALLALGNEVVV